MKKMFFLMAAFLMVAATNVNAQSAKELAKQQQELNEINRKMLNAKPTKEAKKQAKQLKKEGWTVMAGDRSIEQQINESHLYSAELMADENGAQTKRFIIQSGMSTSGTFNAGKAVARAAAQAELASMLKTEIVAAMQQKLDNEQYSGIDAQTIDKFNQRAKFIVDQTLTNTPVFMTIYRRLPNNNFEVQVRLAIDKKELQARLKRNMLKEMENEGDKLNSLVDEVIKNKF
jgi:hypothetical protein